MSKENDKTELLNPDDEIVRLRKELKIKELELKRATMARDAYERMIVIAEEKYAIPIRKSSGSQSAPRRKRHRKGQRPHKAEKRSFDHRPPGGVSSWSICCGALGFFYI